MNEAAASEVNFERASTGVAGLDIILGGGLMVGGIYIVQGAPGAGKTILSNQMCFHHAAGGGRALFVTLLAENHARMTAGMRELSFFDESRIPDGVTYISAFRELRESGLNALGDLIRREIQRRRCTLLILDGLVSAQTSSDTDQAFKEFVHGLQEIALATDCTMLLTTNSAGTDTSPERTMVDGLIELSDRAYGWRSESDLQVHKFRGSGYLRGRHSYEITSDGLVVHPRIEARFAHSGGADAGSDGRVSTGVDKLDGLLGGGLPVASTTMVMGPSGAGKTTMGLQFLSRSSAAEPGLIFGFYEKPDRLRARATGVCPPLLKLFDGGVVEILWQSPAGDLLDAYGERLLEAVQRRGVKRLFIDGLTSFKQYAVEPSRLGQFFAALANELRSLGVTTVYTLEVPDILGPANRVPVDDVSSLAENLILLRYIEVRSRFHRLISILKVRDSDFDPSLHEFILTSQGMVIRETPDSAETVLADLAVGSNAGSSMTGKVVAAAPESAG